MLHAAGWRVVVFATPFGARFADASELERLTGQPVRSEYRMPGTGAPVPPADVVLACPLTFNSVNKFAHGHADNFAVGLLCEMADTPGARIARARRRRGLSQAVLAGLAGRPESWLPQVERGARTLTVMPS